jgi:hypothetical protein
MVSKAGFFEHRPLEIKQSRPSHTMVDLGGEGDCGFRSIAAGLIDNFHTVSKLDDKLLKKVLEQFYIYYPDYKSGKGMLTPKDHFNFLQQQLEPPELTVALAYVLRQMAVDEMLAHPELYRGAFSDKNEGTSPLSMREKSTWIDETSIAALAKVLDININVSVVGRNRELPLNLSYNPEAQTALKPAINIRLEGQHYKAQLINGSYFRSFAERRPRVIKAEEIERSDPSMEEILQRIEAEDRRMLEVYEQMKKALFSAIKNNEMTTKDLLNCYIKSVPSSDYLEGRVKYIGLEFGSQDVFANILEKYGRDNSYESNTSSQEVRVQNELIHALSRAVSIGQLSEDALFQEEVPFQKANP